MTDTLDLERARAGLSLEPGHDAIIAMGTAVVDRVARFIQQLPDRSSTNTVAPEVTAKLVGQFLAPPPEYGVDLSLLLDRLDVAADCALETAGPGHLARVPGGGLYTSALAEFYARAVNRHGGIALEAPVLTALEESVLRWIARDVCGLPEPGSGIFTTGGSMANFSAVIAARHTMLGEELADGTVYLTEQTNHSVAKAAYLAGLKRNNIRLVPCTDDLRMDVRAAAELIREDRSAGLRPFLVVGTAGTTGTGTVDSLPDLADLAEQEGMWFHVDAAYGGFFGLTERGRRRLEGMHRADSITLDPHKTLFLPFGTGALVVRDPALLSSAHEGYGSYLQDFHPINGLPDYAHMSAELTHEVRGVRAWLPLHLHGVSAFREALDEKLDLTQHVYDILSAIPVLEIPCLPDLSTVVFRVRADDGSPAALEEADRKTRALLDFVNRDGRVLLSSTIVGGRQTIRVCVLNHRTHARHVETVLELIDAAATAGVTPQQAVTRPRKDTVD